MFVLLAAGVLGFQLAIFLSMLGAAAMGRGWLKGAAFIWGAFTLFGSIFTFGLLLLQSITIVVSYLVGSALCNRNERLRKARD